MCAHKEGWWMTDVRHYYDANAILSLELLHVPTKGRVSPNHYVGNINTINESSSKYDVLWNHISRGRAEHLIMFCYSSRLLLLSKFSITVNCYDSPPSNRDNIEIDAKGGICFPQNMTECLIMIWIMCSQLWYGALSYILLSKGNKLHEK
jgi:hypothetical protein